MANICCNCKVMSCSWMQDLKPVVGWTATKSVICNNNATPKSKVFSYHITACPEYQEGNLKERKMSEDEE